MYIIIMTTVGNVSEAEKIAEVLIEKKLSPCVQIKDIRSMYFWENKIQKDSEYLLYIKSKKNLFKEIEGEILKISSYENPEIVSVEIKEGTEKYLHWIDESIKHC